MNASAIVTGAASGIGQATAEALTRSGWAVVGVDRDSTALQRLRERQVLAGVVAGDVAERNTHRAARSLASRLAPVTAWVGAAGVTATHDLATIDERLARRLVDINQLGLLWGAAEAVAEWTAMSTPGVIIGVSSVHAQHAYPGHAVYEMTKAAAEALIRSLAVTYGPQGIRAVGVAPGAVETPALAASLNSASDPEAARNHLERQSPARRLATADEIANVITFLLSSSAAYISGTTVTVDGGWSAVLSQPPAAPAAQRPPIDRRV